MYRIFRISLYFLIPYNFCTIIMKLYENDSLNYNQNFYFLFICLMAIFLLVHFFMAQTLYWTNGFLFSRSFYKVLDLDSIGDHPYDLIPWKRVCSKFYKCCRCFLRGGIYMWFVINTIVQKICKYQRFFLWEEKKVRQISDKERELVLILLPF